MDVRHLVQALLDIEDGPPIAPARFREVPAHMKAHVIKGAKQAAVVVPARAVAASVACAACDDGLLGASIFAAPIEPSTIRRGAPPMRQPPVQVAPAISISYLPSRAVIICLLPFQLTNVA